MRLLSLRHPRSHHGYHLLLVLAALLGASLLALVNVPRALACPVCITPDKITVSGDGIVGTASVTNPGLLAWFSAAQFMGFEHRSPIARPVHTGTGVELTRYYKNTGVPASFWTTGFDHMRYYPGAPGQPGFVYYDGPVSTEARDYGNGLDMWQRIGQWYALTSDEEANLRQLLAAATGNPQTSGASSQPPVSSVSSVPPGTARPPAILRALTGISLPIIILSGCMLVLVAAVGYRLLHARRRPPFAPVEETAD